MRYRPPTGNVINASAIVALTAIAVTYLFSLALAKPAVYETSSHSPPSFGEIQERIVNDPTLLYLTRRVVHQAVYEARGREVLAEMPEETQAAVRRITIDDTCHVCIFQQLAHCHAGVDNPRRGEICIGTKVADEIPSTYYHEGAHARAYEVEDYGVPVQRQWVAYGGRPLVTPFFTGTPHQDIAEWASNVILAANGQRSAFSRPENNFRERQSEFLHKLNLLVRWGIIRERHRQSFLASYQ